MTEQFHEYLTPYGKNQNEFVVRMDNNPLTYILTSARLDAAGHRWVANLADYNFSLEYQRGKDNTVADFLSRMKDRLTEEEADKQFTKIPLPEVRAVLDNARIDKLQNVLSWLQLVLRREWISSCSGSSSQSSGSLPGSVIHFACY